MVMSVTEEFSSLSIARKCLQNDETGAYRVYKTLAEYVTVEAATAMEACRMSGISQPLRIQRVTRFKERLLDQSKFSETVEMFEIGPGMDKLAQMAGLADELISHVAAPPAPPPAPEAPAPAPAPIAAEMPEIDHGRHALDLSDVIPAAAAVADEVPVTQGLTEEGDDLSADDIAALLNNKHSGAEAAPKPDDDDDEWEKV